MAKKPLKFGPRKRFAEGGSDKYKAKFDRKVADIESDYKKAQVGKTGRAADVAKAKYEQRMADAKDDFAKWTGADRTATRAGERAAERNLTLTRRYGSAEPKFGEDKPLVTPTSMSDAEVSKITSMLPKSQSFKEAFAAARKDPASMKAGKFSWNGKDYSTALASDRKPRPAPTPRTAASSGRDRPATTPKTNPTPTPAASSQSRTPPGSTPKPGPARTAPEFTLTPAEKRAAELRKMAAADRKLESAPAGSPGAAAARLKKYLGITSSRESSATAMEKQAQRKRWQDVEAQGAKDAQDYASAKKRADRIAAGSKPNATPTEKFYAKYPDAMKKGGAVKKYAKGGRIDGCAVRGKTKARKK